MTLDLMIFISDPQLGRGDVNRNVLHAKSVFETAAEMEKTNEYRCRGIIVVGDLTNYGHDDQLDKYKELYESQSFLVFPGLGNHDYQLNVNDTFENRGATRMVEYLISSVHNVAAKVGVNFDVNEDSSPTKKTITGSLDYSWDIGNIHYVNANNYPAYQNSWSNFRSDRGKSIAVNIHPCWEWLEKDLRFARKQGKSIILNIHDMMNNWTDSDAKKFWELCQKFSVSAVFCGHDHAHGDKTGFYTSPNPCMNGHGIPKFNCGSADWNKYLYAWVEQGGSISPDGYPLDTMNVKIIDSSNGTCNILPDVWFVRLLRPSEVFIENSGDFVAKYIISFYWGGNKKLESEEQARGSTCGFAIPDDATNLHLRMMCKGSDTWKDIMSQDIKNPNGRMYYYHVTGTFSAPYWNLE
ncbi:3',5'-cyclic adenosine monophosphate phosphodiesterase CpdA [uncultured archaeon]|nr:3',5'-cyclic adenosine monophosphate phosphodiesterase CpdA [uncultured archaeon]